MSPEHMLHLPDIAERVSRYISHEDQYQQLIQQNSQIDENILIFDLMEVDQIIAVVGIDKKADRQ